MTDDEVDEKHGHGRENDLYMSVTVRSTNSDSNAIRRRFYVGNLLILLHLPFTLDPSQLLCQLCTRSQNHRDSVIEDGDLGSELTNEGSVRCVGWVLRSRVVGLFSCGARWSIAMRETKCLLWDS
jgi:hypothetical protein